MGAITGTVNGKVGDDVTGVCVGLREGFIVGVSDGDNTPAVGRLVGTVNGLKDGVAVGIAVGRFVTSRYFTSLNTIYI